MANVLVRCVVGIVAAGASLSPSFACGGIEAWLTDEQIAIVKAGGPIPMGIGFVPGEWQWSVEIPVAMPIIEPPTINPAAVVADGTDVMADARSHVFAAADQVFDVTLTAILPSSQLAAAEPLVESSPALPPPDTKRVVIVCGGEVLVEPNVL
ncbi:MAG: hypothetical protein SGI91_15615 [Alphaproteobacteria bacterium]|nr:hypothetical protein [Alphaproteobacteria bacterium]